MTIFELLALGIQRGISPITALLAPRLPANILLTASGPAVIYTQIMESDDRPFRGSGRFPAGIVSSSSW